MRATKSMIMAALAVGFFLFSIGTYQAKSGGSSSGFLQMTIVNSAGAGLTGDGQKIDNYGNSLYTDHDVSTGDPCVTAVVSKGSVVVQQNYLISTHPKEVWCNQGAGITPRYWNIVIDDTAACQFVFGTSPSPPVPCTFTGSDMEKTDYESFEPGDAFSSSSSQVIMQFTQNGRTDGYSVRTDGSATVTGSGDSRVVTYSGTAQLYHAGEPTGTGHFSFPFQVNLDEL
jgi:hypothetical protein